jgi:hypothetical protein
MSGPIYHTAFEQGSDQWLNARCGLLTASEMKNIITPKQLKLSAAATAHMFELLAQRITRYVEPYYVSDDMLRGQEDEIDARTLYGRHHAPVTEAGFITNDRWGFTIGYSPDGIVGDDGLIECKSRRQKYQVQTAIECLSSGIPPAEFMLQMQTGMMVSEREWCDFISYSGGLPMIVIRVHADPIVQNAIEEAAGEFERRLSEAFDQYHDAITAAQSIPTDRKIEQEMHI